MTRYAVFEVTTEPREDGGLRVSSSDLPGLILSGRNPDEVRADIPVAARALLEYAGLSVLSVHEAQRNHYAVAYADRAGG